MAFRLVEPVSRRSLPDRVLAHAAAFPYGFVYGSRHDVAAWSENERRDFRNFALSIVSASRTPTKSSHTAPNSKILLRDVPMMVTAVTSP
jgi:hypothetical protein